MSLFSQPAWLRDLQGLNEVTQFNLFMPNNIRHLTSLENSASFERGLKQFLYWKGQLMPSLTKKTVFLAFLGPKGLVFPDIINVCRALKPICDFGQLIETYQGANSNFLAFSFNLSSVIQDILAKFTFFEDSVVLPIAYCGEEYHRFRLLWLPPLFDVARVHHLLGGLTLSHRLKRESIHIGDGNFSPTNAVSGTFTLKPGTTIHQLPHMIWLPSPHKGCALLQIESRPPLCLKCRSVGHTRKKCNMTRCSTCSKVHFPHATCGTSSYSSVASKAITILQEDSWIAHLSEDLYQDPTLPIVQEVVSVIPVGSSFFPSSNHRPTDSDNLVTFSKSDIIEAEADIDSNAECGSTLCIVTGCNSVPDLSDNSIHQAAAADALGFDNITSQIDKLNQIPLPTNCTFEKDLTASITSHDVIPFSPPATRSQTSAKKRLVSYSHDVKQTLRSEMLPYKLHSSKLISKESQQSTITSHFPPLVTSSLSLDHTIESEAFLDQADLSDISVDLSQDSDAMDYLSSRKRKISLHTSHEDASLHNPSDSEAISDHDDSSTSDITPSLDFNRTSPASSSVNDAAVSLSEPDSILASQFSLSSADFNRLKKVCPKQEMSPTIIKKIKLLQSHSIPILHIIDFPEFFNLSPSTISSRLKTLSKHQASPLTITDLFQSSIKYKRMDGTCPPPQYVLPSTPVDPFKSPFS